MTDGDEVGIDCGGSCEICPMLQFIPSLSLRVPAEVMSGEEFNITVVDDGGNGVSAFVRIKKPDGKEMFLTTNRKGFTSVKSDVPGYWQLTAVKAGYLPAIARVRVIEIVTPEVMIYRTVSYLLPILVGLSMLLYLLTRRTKVVFDPAALLKIIEEDRLMEYTKVFVVENVYNELSTRAGSNKNRLVPLKLSDRELGKADDISSEYGIEVSLARALLLAEKLKAKTLYTGAQTGNLGKMYRGIKIVQK